MSSISIVIISYNASRKISEVLKQARKLSEDIVVLDSGSTDNTKELCTTFNVNFQNQAWLGYGKQKNLANSYAQNDWILSLDADEVLSEELIQELKTKTLSPGKVYEIPFRNIYCHKEIRFGKRKNEKHIRRFNRTEVQWDEAAVHEGLIWNGMDKIKLKGKIFHHSMESKSAHLSKAKHYARIGAEKLKAKGKKATFLKLYINPLYRFVKDYFFSLGFLDGKLGFQIALIIAKESYWKYKNLKEIS